MSLRDAAIIERDALATAIALLEEREILTKDANERDLIRLRLPLMKEKRHRLVQRINADTLPNIEPPSAPELAEARQAAAALDTIIAQNTTARVVLDAARAASDLVKV